MNWSKHLSKAETICPCGCGKNDMKPKIISIFENLRARVGEPLHINSGFRCEKHNKAVGGKKDSQHLLGMALDINLPKGIPAKEMEGYMELSGAGGIGRYKTFCHCDAREGTFRWQG